jgi:hypothetical protein
MFSSDTVKDSGIVASAARPGVFSSSRSDGKCLEGKVKAKRVPFGTFLNIQINTIISERRGMHR